MSGLVSFKGKKNDDSKKRTKKTESYDTFGCNKENL